MNGNSSSTRRRFLQAAAGAALCTGFPMINTGRYRLLAATTRKYSARATKIVERALVIDMLGVIKLDFEPTAFANPATPDEAAMYRASGVSAIHNAVGVGGREEALEFLAAWQGYAGRNADLYSLVGNAYDLDKAKAQNKIAVIMGIQNAEHFRDAKDVKTFYQLGQRCSQLTYNSQNLLGAGATDRIDGGVSD
jgi:membrane dipeptidase